MPHRPLELVLAWHMHQPDYRDYATGEFRLPWVYLHAIKDYTDMAAHLERHEGMRAVVNFSPVLLEQVEDYADQFATGRWRDPLLKLLSRDPSTPLTAEDRAFLARRCFEANRATMIQPFAAYKGLHEVYAAMKERVPGASDYLSETFYDDLVTWYHLCWTGETVRRSSETVARLMSKGARFTFEDRRDLARVLGELIAGLIPRYAKLAASGRVELSTTPDHHPLAPLLINLASAREAMPNAELPRSPDYPGGTHRVATQLRAAIESHTRRFGVAPTGVWPAEGAVSSALLPVLEANGAKWCATGETVLVHSLHWEDRNTFQTGAMHRPYRFAALASSLTIFFRSDRLSDLIGFEYARWNGNDAASNFVSELEAIASAIPKGEKRVVSVILDGENCWEYYDYNGYYFLDALYRMLEAHPRVRSTTFKATVERKDLEAARLDKLVAGSWVYGNFSTWIGSPEKNRAWELLCAVKQSYDLVMASGRLDDAQRAAAARQLSACEASDWFWWLGDYNPKAAVASFDELFRGSLANLYRLLLLPAPAALSQPICTGGGHPESGGTMRRAGEAVPGN